MIQTLRSRFLLGLLGLMTAVSSAATAAEKVALVIGNSDYQHASYLPNPVKDAQQMEKALSRLGFAVEPVFTNQSKTALENALRTFRPKADQAKVAVVFYAGHGIESNGINYLVPVDARLQDERDLTFEGVSLDLLLAQIEGARDFRLVILDACRDNPLANKMLRRNGTRSTFRGLARIEPQGATYVAYSARHGTRARDDSPFLKSLLKHIEQPLPLWNLFGTVREDVLRATNNEQEPYLYGTPTSRPLCLLASCDSSAPVLPIISESPKVVLAVKATPVDALVRIMNIVPRYRHGIELAPGRYDIEVSKAGYQTDRQWYELGAGERVISVELATLASIVEPEAVQPKPSGPHRDQLRSGGEGPEMVFIQGGTFLMGSPASEEGRDDDERQHRVTVDDFYIGKYEVTFAEYDRFAEATGRDKPDDEGWGRGNRPVINVDWHDAVAYAAWLSSETGERYRLPTEAEWEYAARGGSESAYWWGTKASHQYANYGQEECCGGKIEGKDQWQYTAPVGRFLANAYGLHDVAGNVWEWTCSEYDVDYQGKEQKCMGNNDATTLRVVRGGSGNSIPRWVRSALRFRFGPTFRLSFVGFRLARSL